MYVELLIGALTVLLVWDYLHKRRISQVFKANGLTGPSELPILGSSHNLIGYNSETVIDLFAQFAKRFNKTWRLWMLHEPNIVTCNPKLIEPILSSQKVITKNRLYELLHTWLGTGLLLSTGRKWHARRKIITPTFHFKILEQFVDIFDKQSAIMVKKLAERADGKTSVDIFPVVCLAALDTIAETSMGVKVNAQTQPDFPYVKAVQTVASITADRFISMTERFDSSMRWISPLRFRKLQKAIELTHDFTNKVIAERRATLEKSIADGTAKSTEDEDDVGSKKRMALLDVLLQSTIGGAPLSDEDIREEVDTFMFEGHDTTTSGISHTLFLISRHPEVQAKLFAEIRSVIGDDKNEPITMRDLQEMKYLDCVIKEGLRLYPPVPIIGRHVEEDTELNGMTFPAGCNVIVLIYHALRDADYFPDPEAFKPERFGPDSEQKIDPFAYVPFSAGPRNCIGQKFALLEMKSTITKVLRHYELLPLGEKVRPILNVILRSANGIHLGLKPRVY